MKQIEKYKVHKDGSISNTNTGRVLKPQDNGNGYKKLTLTINGVQVQRLIHRLVADAYCYKPQSIEKLQVNHKDGDKSNNIHTNLEWVTQSENQAHSALNGFHKSGEGHYMSKFNSDQIRVMRRMDEAGIKRYVIAEKFGCVKSTVSDILNGNRYKTSH